MQGIVWILFFYLLGCVVAALTGNFIPGSVVGMLLLFGALSLGWIRPWRMKRAAGFLLDNMMLFFIPVGVGLIASYSLVSKYLTAILVASIVSTILVIIVVGIVEQKLEAKKGSENDDDQPDNGVETLPTDNPIDNKPTTGEEQTIAPKVTATNADTMSSTTENETPINKTTDISAHTISDLPCESNTNPEEPAYSSFHSTKSDSHE